MDRLVVAGRLQHDRDGRRRGPQLPVRDGEQVLVELPRVEDRHPLLRETRRTGPGQERGQDAAEGGGEKSQCGGPKINNWRGK